MSENILKGLPPCHKCGWRELAHTNNGRGEHLIFCNLCWHYIGWQPSLEDSRATWCALALKNGTKSEPEAPAKSKPKPFTAAEFVSNEKTPVVDTDNRKVHILSMKGRGPYNVVGHPGDTGHLSSWKPELLRFAPVKRLVEVNIYSIPGDNNGAVYASIVGTPVDKRRMEGTGFKRLGTITGEVEL